MDQHGFLIVARYANKVQTFVQHTEQIGLDGILQRHEFGNDERVVAQQLGGQRNRFQCHNVRDAVLDQSRTIDGGRIVACG